MDGRDPEDMSRIYFALFQEKKQQRLKGLMDKYDHVPKKRIKELFDDLQKDFYVRENGIFGEDDNHPLSIYEDNRWVIDIFPDESFDMERLNGCMALSKIFSKHDIKYEISDISEAEKIIARHNHELKDTFNKLKEPSPIITEWDF